MNENIGAMKAQIDQIQAKAMARLEPIPPGELILHLETLLDSLPSVQDPTTAAIVSVGIAEVYQNTLSRIAEEQRRKEDNGSED